MARKNLPPTPVEPRDIKTAVDLVDALRHYKSDPAPVLEVISGALEKSPSVRLDRVEWYFAVDPNDTGEIGPRKKNRIEGTPIERDPKYSHYHIAVFKGHLPAFSGDYRAAIRQADEIAAELARHPDVKQARVLEYPLNITSEVNLSGTATEGSERSEARFAVKVVLGIMEPQPNSAAIELRSGVVPAGERIAANSSDGLHDSRRQDGRARRAGRRSAN